MQTLECGGSVKGSWHNSVQMRWRDVRESQMGWLVATELIPTHDAVVFPSSGRLTSLVVFPKEAVKVSLVQKHKAIGHVYGFLRFTGAKLPCKPCLGTLLGILAWCLVLAYMFRNLPSEDCCRIWYAHTCYGLRNIPSPCACSLAWKPQVCNRWTPWTWTFLKRLRHQLMAVSEISVTCERIGCNEHGKQCSEDHALVRKLVGTVRTGLDEIQDLNPG